MKTTAQIFRSIFRSVLYPAVSTLLLASPTSSAMQAPQGVAPWVGKTVEGSFCRGRTQGFGPYDYRNRHHLKEELYIVERAHFTPKVESLIKGNTGPLVHDIDYTLSAWPNHHRALMSIIRYKLQNRKDRPHPRSPAECYLQRAINYSKNDSVAIILYAIFLQRMGHKQEALQRYKQAEKLAPNNPELHYNFGLLLVSLKRYDEARAHAVEAYKRGYPLPGLKRKLRNLGYWSKTAKTPE